MSDRRDMELIAELVPRGSRVLDLGCASGELLAYLRDDARYHAVLRACFANIATEGHGLARAERRAAPKPARIPSGDRPTYSSDEGSS